MSASGCQNKLPQNGWLKQWKFIFSQFWRLKVYDEGLVSNKVGFLCYKLTPSLYVFTPFFLICAQRNRKKGTQRENKRKRVKLSFLSSCQTLILLNQGLTLMTSFNFNYFLRAPISKYSHTRRWRFNIQIQICRGSKYSVQTKKKKKKRIRTIIH